MDGWEKGKREGPKKGEREGGREGGSDKGTCVELGRKRKQFPHVHVLTWFRTDLDRSDDLSSLESVVKKPRLTPGPEPSSPSNLTRT